MLYYCSLSDNVCFYKRVVSFFVKQSYTENKCFKAALSAFAANPLRQEVQS